MKASRALYPDLHFVICVTVHRERLESLTAICKTTGKNTWRTETIWFSAQLKSQTATAQSVRPSQATSARAAIFRLAWGGRLDGA